MILAAALALLSIGLAEAGWLQANGISALTLAIVLGIAVGNSVYPRLAASSAPGVNFSKQTLLRLGIVLYGIRLTFQDIRHVGFAGVIIDTVVVCSTFALAWLLGTRLFGLDRRTAMLIGAGSSICGAAAVMAAEPVVRGRSDQVTVAVSTVVVFGTLAIFLYPALYHLNSSYHLLGSASPAAYGLFAGSTIHEVAQVVAAGRAIGEQAAATAVITKMVRVMLLAPFLLALSVYLSREKPPEPAREPANDHAHDPACDLPHDSGHDLVHDPARDAAQAKPRISIPWFALGFIALTGLNSLVVLPAHLTALATQFDTFVLAMAMAALCLTTHVSAIRSAGTRPLALAAVLFTWLVAGGIAINVAVTSLLN
jgi:uncharacterized integral membrane protein (TIGR00698 family)